MFKFIVVAVLGMVSQGAMATSQSQQEQPDPIIAMIQAAKDQGLAVAQCRYGLCRDTEDGDYVVIDGYDKDGYYAYDPSVATPSDGFDSNMVEN